MLSRVTFMDTHRSPRFMSLVVRGERVAIPFRIYGDRSALDDLKLTPRDLLFLHCLFTRHHDGFVRERSLRNIIDSTEPWVTPFVVQLASEYVVEIVEFIEANLRHLSTNDCRAFLRENPEFYSRTRARIMSYWDCYYRRDRFRDPKRYPGLWCATFSIRCSPGDVHHSRSASLKIPYCS